MKKGSQATPNRQLIDERLRRRWTQQEVADHIGTTSTNYSRWERGVTSPGSYFRSQLCLLFGKSPRELGLLQAEIEGIPLPDGLYDPVIPIHQLLIGRESLLAALKHQLCESKEMTLSALHGLPGVGKTALAAALVSDQMVREHFHDGILWAGLGPQPNLFGLLSRWGSLLGMTSIEKLNSIDSWAVALRTIIGQLRMLLVLDDVWQIENALALKVGGPNCTYLLTSRFTDIAFHFTAEGAMPVSELEEDKGLLLLARFIPQVVEAEPEAAIRLVRAVGGLPLALTLIGKHLQFHAYMRQPRRLQAALERLEQTEERFRLNLPQASLERSPHLPAGSSLSLQSSIAISVQHLDEQARSALYALAAFPPKPNTFSEEAALAVTGTEPDILDRLSDAGLVESSGPGRYTLHQTIVDYARLVHHDPHAEKRLVEYMIGYAERHEKDDAALEQEHVNICSALDGAADRNMQTLLLRGVNAFEPYLEKRGMYPLAALYLKRAEEAARLLEDATSLSRLLCHQGHIARRLGEYQQSELYLQEGLHLAVQHRLSQQQVLLLRELGSLAFVRAQYSQAEVYIQQGLALARQNDDHELMDWMRNLLAGIYNNRGDYAKADVLCQEALEIDRQQGRHEKVIIDLMNLGVTATQQGHFAQAETYLQEGLVLARQMNHRDMAGMLINLGVLTLERGNYSQAQAYLQEALNLARQMSNQERLGYVLVNLAQTLLQQGQYAQAEVYLQEGLTLTRQIGQQEITAACLLLLGEGATRQGHYAKAEAYLREGLALVRLLEHIRLLCSMLYAWGELALEQQQIETAAAAFEEMLTLVPEGAQDLVAQAQFGQARVCAANGNIDEARQRGETSLSLFGTIRHRQTSEVRDFLKVLPAQALH